MNQFSYATERQYCLVNRPFLTRATDKLHIYWFIHQIYVCRRKQNIHIYQTQTNVRKRNITENKINLSAIRVCQYTSILFFDG